MSELSERVRRVPWLMLAMVPLLCAIGIISMADARAGKQLVWMGVGLLAMVATVVIPYRRLGERAYVIFGVSLALLAVLFVLPEAICPTKNGARRWIRLVPGQDVLLQPSELAKFAYILMLAWYLRFRSNYRSLRGLLVPFALTLAPLGLVLKQPDLGTALLFVPTLFAMLYLAGARALHLGAIVLLGVLLLGGVVFYQIYLPRYLPALREQPGRLPLRPHQEARIRVWLTQGRWSNLVEKNEAYQINQSLMAVGSGGVIGQSPEDAVFTRYDLLPEEDTDFIFSLIGHQWGLLGCAALLGAYMIIFAAGVEIAAGTADPFGRLLAIGVVALFAAQMSINTGMAIGLLPVTGMTLPFVSYGGSSLVVNFAALGLLINVAQHRPIILYRRRFEWRDEEGELT